MKQSIPLLALLFTNSLALAEPVQRLYLDPDKAVEIGIGAKTATTLQFPRAVRGIFGYGLTQGDAPGTYHYHHPDGARVMTLRNLMADKETLVTILLGEDDLYVLRLKPASDPPVAVHLLDPGSRETAYRAVSIDPEAAAARKLTQDTERLFNLLKLGKNERVFRVALPHLYKKAESRKVEFKHDDGELASVVTILHRFPDEDAIFLGGEITNSTDEPQYLDPGGFQVRVGTRTYPIALADCAEEIPAKGKVPFHVILRGGVEGERAHLSIKNEFRLILPAYETWTDSPALTDELGLVVGPPGSKGEPKIDASLFGKQAPTEGSGSK